MKTLPVAVLVVLVVLCGGAHAKPSLHPWGLVPVALGHHPSIVVTAGSSPEAVSNAVVAVNDAVVAANDAAQRTVDVVRAASDAHVEASGRAVQHVVDAVIQANSHTAEAVGQAADHVAVALDSVHGVKILI